MFPSCFDFPFNGQHALYMARRAKGAPPEAVPFAKPPRAEALGTARPATMEAVCVPCPSLSRADL